MLGETGYAYEVLMYMNLFKWCAFREGRKFCFGVYSWRLWHVSWSLQLETRHVSWVLWEADIETELGVEAVLLEITPMKYKRQRNYIGQGMPTDQTKSQKIQQGALKQRLSMRLSPLVSRNGQALVPPLFSDQLGNTQEEQPRTTVSVVDNGSCHERLSESCNERCVNNCETS